MPFNIRLLFFALVSCLLLLSASCAKDDTVEVDIVIYTIACRDKNCKPFSVEYNSPQGTLVEGPITNETWISKKIEGFKRGDYVSLKINTNTNTNYLLSIYFNGILLSEKLVAWPYSNAVNAVLPPQI